MLIVIQDHEVITSVPEDCQKSLAGLVFLFLFSNKGSPWEPFLTTGSTFS